MALALGEKVKGSATAGEGGLLEYLGVMVEELAVHSTSGGLIHIDTQLLALISGVFVPLLVGLITKAAASAPLKSLLNALLSAAAGAVSTAIAAGGAVNWKVYALNIGLAWTISVASYYGLWKPSAVASAVNKATPNFGFGRSAPPAAAPPPNAGRRWGDHRLHHGG